MPIRHAEEIGGYNYLHFYFQNANIGMTISDFQIAKTKILREQQNVFNQRIKQQMFSGSKNEELQKTLLDTTENSIVGKNLDNTIREIFNNFIAPTAGSLTGVNIDGENTSFAQIGNLKNIQGALSRHGKQLVDEVGTFISSAETYMNEALKILSNYSDAIVGSALKEIAEKQATLSAQELCQQYLVSGKKNTLLDTSNMDSELGSALRAIERITGLISSLKNISSLKVSKLKYNTSDNSKLKKVGTRSRLVSVIVGKLGGNFSSVGGAVEEIANMKALEKTLIEGNQAAEIKTEWTSGATKKGENFAVTKVIDKDKKEKIKPFTGTFSKGDVTMTVTQNGVTMTFGAQIKTSKAKNPKRQGVIKLQDSASLEVILSHFVNKGYSSWRDINHIAASHDFSGNRRNNGMYSDKKELTDLWRSLVDCAVANYFMAALVGNKWNSSSKNLILVANRRVYSISEVYEKVLEAPEGIMYDGGKQRYRFADLNQWVGNVKSAAGGQIRSNKAQLSLHNAYTAQKITIKLNMNAIGLSIPNLNNLT